MGNSTKHKVNDTQLKKDIAEYARRNVELLTQGYEFEDTHEDVSNLFQMLSNDKNLFSTNGRFTR